MFQDLFSRTDVFLLFTNFRTFLTSLIKTMCKCLKMAIITLSLATILLIFFVEEYYNKKNVFIKIYFEIFPKLLINNPHTSPHRQHPKNLQQRQQILKNPPFVRHAPLSEPQYEPTYNIYALSNKFLIE